MTLTKEISISDIMNIVLMAVYVGATIAICGFNAKSANASKEQIKESQKQFKEINAAQVMVTFKAISLNTYGFVISNIGNSYAKNIKIICSQNIIDASKEEVKLCLETLCKSMFVLAPKQEFILPLFESQIKNLFDYVVDFDISYQSENDNLNSKISIDLSQYAWTGNLKSKNEKFIDETLKFEDNFIQQLENLNLGIERLNNNLNKFKGKEFSVFQNSQKK